MAKWVKRTKTAPRWKLTPSTAKIATSGREKQTL